MEKLVRRCRAAEQRTAYLSCRLLESDETIRQQEEKLAVYENDLMAFADVANDEETSAVAEQVVQQHARVGEDSVMAVALDVKENDLPDDEEKLAGSVGVEEEIDLQADDSDGGVDGEATNSC
ncbi:uncharacterized protein AB9X84_022960 [Acanthopagrus schlegelii]